MTTALDTWRERLDRPTRFEGATPAQAIREAHKSAGGTLADFTSWLADHGLRPFTTGKGYVLNIPHTPEYKLTAMAITSDGKNTY